MEVFLYVDTHGFLKEFLSQAITCVQTASFVLAIDIYGEAREVQKVHIQTCFFCAQSLSFVGTFGS